MLYSFSPASRRCFRDKGSALAGIVAEAQAHPRLARVRRSRVRHQRLCIRRAEKAQPEARFDH